MINNDFLYAFSKALVFLMFTKGLLSFEEFKEIDAKNKVSFSLN
jgi:hypothetical protein